MTGTTTHRTWRRGGALLAVRQGAGLAFSAAAVAAGRERAGEPKELYVVPSAGRVDLYDKTDLIPFDKLEEFFTDNLAAPSNGAAAELVGSRS